MKNIIEQNEITRDLLIKQYQTYPKLQIEDIFKYIFQSAFGCEHLVSSEDAVLKYIRREYESLQKTSSRILEPLDGKYSRAHLSCLNAGLKPETLGKMFCLSAKKEHNGKALLEQKLKVAKELIVNGDLPFKIDDFERKVGECREMLG